MATYWHVTQKMLEDNPHLEKLIFPMGFSHENEYRGMFYHIPQTHPNSLMIALALPNDVTIVNITPLPPGDPYRPKWIIEPAKS